MSRLEVLAVASEVFPLVKTGGLADVVGALPKALAREEVRLRTLVPGYRPVLAGLEGRKVIRRFDDWFGGPAELLSGEADGLPLFVLDAPHLYDRDGGPYADAQGRDFGDNAIRFAALARMGANIAQGCAPRYRPAVVQTHDWQAGLTAAYLHFDGGPRPGVVCTIHNLAFQGQFDRALLGRLGLGPEAFTPDGVEYYGDIGFLKAGVRLADRITTVSPTYAAEICTPQGGMGMDGLLRGRADRLSGIVNGVDTDVWDPAADPLIAAPFSATDLAGRAADKAALQERLHLDCDPGAPLFGVVSRLSWQKGVDLLAQALPTLIAHGGQLALLGSGDAALEGELLHAARTHPGRIACVLGYDEALAHQIQAGADAILVPSRFEPCGLTQLCAMRYGAVPVVARVGGLADTVIDAAPMALASGAATGVQFAPVEVAALEIALRRTIALYRDRPAWSRLQAQGLQTDVSWARPAKLYAELFADLVRERGG
ncbi:glycogen synthase GlgA [Phenylobacterium soli]|uniref:Glycogen synthase n=1 Tax=Phenylobacterium soli TaxID=2170551 RepID=A0A328AJD9_9CAUL|nr:glycogen synthase GlgA [Phenylobacterium soli]RAK54982.1 glycogen synthase GlgA [Phenylobacterium soli]